MSCNCSLSMENVKRENEKGNSPRFGRRFEHLPPLVARVGSSPEGNLRSK